MFLIIYKEPIAISTARTLSSVIAHAIPRDVIKKLMEMNSKFEESIYKSAVYYLVNIYKEKGLKKKKKTNNYRFYYFIIFSLITCKY